MEFFISYENIASLFLVTYIVIFFSLIGIIFFAADYIQILLYVEQALLAININFVYSSLYLDDITGQIFVIFILSVAAAEAAIALSIFIILYRVSDSVIVMLFFFLLCETIK